VLSFQTVRSTHTITPPSARVPPQSHAPRITLPSSRTLDKRPSSRGLSGGAAQRSSFLELDAQALQPLQSGAYDAIGPPHPRHQGCPTRKTGSRRYSPQLGCGAPGVRPETSRKKSIGRRQLRLRRSRSPAAWSPAQRPTTNSPPPTPREPRCDRQRLTTRGASGSITNCSVLRPLTAHVLQPPTTASCSLDRTHLSSGYPQQVAASECKRGRRGRAVPAARCLISRPRDPACRTS
jgi:hypothetical protein